MNLDAAQKAKVAKWIEEGLKLADIQKRVSSELGLNLTYMEVRFLVDDLKLVPKDPVPAKTPDSPLTAPANAPAPAPAAAPAPTVPPASTAPPPEAPGAGNVSLTLDELTRPGAIVSGKVTFSDGNKADWYLDQMGRLGLTPQQQGYRPSQADVQEFQVQLQNELAKMGF